MTSSNEIVICKNGFILLKCSRKETLNMATNTTRIFHIELTMTKSNAPSTFYYLRQQPTDTKCCVTTTFSMSLHRKYSHNLSTKTWARNNVYLDFDSDLVLYFFFSFLIASTPHLWLAGFSKWLAGCLFAWQVHPWNIIVVGIKVCVFFSLATSLGFWFSVRFCCVVFCFAFNFKHWYLHAINSNFCELFN